MYNCILIVYLQTFGWQKVCKSILERKRNTEWNTETNEFLIDGFHWQSNRFSTSFCFLFEQPHLFFFSQKINLTFTYKFCSNCRLCKWIVFPCNFFVFLRFCFHFLTSRSIGPTFVLVIRVQSDTFCGSSRTVPRIFVFSFSGAGATNYLSNYLTNKLTKHTYTNGSILPGHV